LEELESALARGAKIYAEIIGYGLSGDAYHITSPDPEGKGGSYCIRMALNDADINITEIDYINAHGTSTQVGDLSETRTIKAVFGKQAYKIPVSANKSMLGHLWGAAGGMQSIVAIMSICQGIIPPTINYETPDPLCDLNYVTNKALHTEVNTALTQAFGFGGTNAALVFTRFSHLD
jgi:3-oxoacyl-[acyl-carrier-protein] synthase II